MAESHESDFALMIDDAQGDVEYWSGVAVGAATWEAADPEANQTASADAYRYWWGRYSDSLGIGMSPWTLRLEDNFCHNYREEANPFQAFVRFSYKGNAYTIVYDNIDCEENEIGHHVALYRNERHVTTFDFAYERLTPGLLVEGDTEWGPDSIFSGLYVETLVRENTDECPETGPRACGGHWRDRLPDEGTVADFTVYEPPAQETTEETEPDVRGSPAPAALAAVVLGMLLGRARRR